VNWLETARFLAVALLLSFLNLPQARGQLVMSNLGAINQNFDTLGSSANLPPHWRVTFGKSPTWSSGDTIVNFVANSGSPQIAGTYNWGDSGFTNRALGVLGQSSFGADSVMLRVRNSTSSAIRSFAVGYSVKQYYRGGSEAQIRFYYSTNGVDWNWVSSTDNALTSSTFIGPAGYLFDSPNTYSIPAVHFSIPSLPPNVDIYFRWHFVIPESGSGLGVDDIWITPVASSVAPSDFTYQSASGGIRITGYIGTAAAVSIPASINGQTVVGIGTGAFAQRTDITLMELPATVTFIEDGAFYECSNLSTINLPLGLQSIGRDAFSGCTKLNSVTLPVSIAYLGERVFKGCSALTDLTISYSLSQVDIPPEAFRDCVSLRNITIPGSVRAIGDRAFYGCVNLSSAWLSSGVETLGMEAFRNCYSLSSVTLSSTLRFIGSGAFRDCANFPSISIGSQVTSIENGAFYGCQSLTSVNVNASNPQYSSLDGVLFDKWQTQLLLFPAGKSGSYVVPWGVLSVSHDAFFGCSELQSITLPPTLSGGVDLQGCTGLTNATVPDSVSFFLPNSSALGVLRYIYNEGMMGVTGYQRFISQPFSLAIPASIYGFAVTQIANRAFAGSALTAVTIPASVTSIGEQAFADTPLTSATIASGSIGMESFRGCSQLTSVSLGNNVTGIGDYAFSGTQITSVIIPASVTSIGEHSFAYTPITNATIASGSIARGAFSDCYQLTRVSLGNNVTSIGDYAFSGTQITSVNIPASVTSVGTNPFINCAHLTAITVDIDNSNYSSLDGVLFDKGLTALFAFPGSKTGVYSLPPGVTTIEYGAFANTALIGVNLGSDLTLIGEFAFSETGLTSIVIPASVASIGWGAFNSSPHLTSVLFKGHAPANTGWSASLAQNATIFYLPGASGWGNSYGFRPTQVFQPSATLPNFAQSTGFQFSWTGTGLIPMNIQRSTSLNGPWSLVSSGNISGAYTDTSPPSGQSFYRAVLP